MESRTRGIEAGRSVLLHTALDAHRPKAYAGTAGGVVVNDCRTNICIGDNGG